MRSSINISKRKGERGVTILLVAVALVALLGMAALAIDVVTLFVARTEAQRAADLAALAGAKIFVTSGFTSGQLGAVDSGGAQNQVCVSGGPGGTGLANQAAEAVAGQNQVSGQAATVASITCNFNVPSHPENPQIIVTIQRNGLPTFFAKVFGIQAGGRVSATATAEAYNPSGSSLPILVASVKPWLIPNCDPALITTCPGNELLDTGTFALKNPANYIGKSYVFTQRGNSGTAPGTPWYYALDMSGTQATICPPTSALPAGSCSLAGGGGYYDNIACANRNELTCGSTVPVDVTTGTLGADTLGGTQCIMHTTGVAASACTDPSPDCFVVPTTPGSPVIINGGLSNPVSPSIPNISRSDSVVTVPIYDGTQLCTAGVCGTATVIGFLQLGIQYVTPAGGISAVILNAAGCDPGGSGTPVSGGSVTPIPVRLDHN